MVAQTCLHLRHMQGLVMLALSHKRLRKPAASGALARARSARSAALQRGSTRDAPGCARA